MHKISRRKVMREIRKNVDLRERQYHKTYSEERRDYQRVKVWNVDNPTRVAVEAQIFLISKGYAGIKVNAVLAKGRGYCGGLDGVEFCFDYNLYMK